MGSPSKVIPNARAARAGGSSLVFPGDLQSHQYYTQLRFVKYQRERPSDSTKEQGTGTVLLPIPAHLPEHSEILYTGSNLGLMGGRVSDYKRGWEELKKTGNSVLDTIKSSIKNGEWQGFDPNTSKAAIAQAIALMPRDWADTDIGKAALSHAGTIPNPHLTNIFDGVALRNFTLGWILSPRSEQDSRVLWNILQFIKGRAHPSYTANTARFALDYPDEVYVSFEGVGFVERSKKAVVTNIDIEYAESGPAFYRGGVPVLTRLEMRFQEVEIRTQEDYVGSGSGPVAPLTADKPGIPSPGNGGGAGGSGYVGTSPTKPNVPGTQLGQGDTPGPGQGGSGDGSGVGNTSESGPMTFTVKPRRNR